MQRDEAAIERKGGARRLALRCGLLLVMLGAAPVRGAPPDAVTMDVGDEPGRVSTEEVRIEDGPFARQLVFFRSNEAPGTLVISTADRFLYLVLGNNRALRYGIGVGRDGFQWSGLVKISRKAEWPDWTPPPEMIARQPYLPRFMAGGPGNPMGRGRCILARPSIAFTAPISRRRSARRCRPAASASPTATSSISFSRVDVGAKVIIRQAAQL